MVKVFHNPICVRKICSYTHESQYKKKGKKPLLATLVKKYTTLKTIYSNIIGDELRYKLTL